MKITELLTKPFVFIALLILIQDAKSQVNEMFAMKETVCLSRISRRQYDTAIRYFVLERDSFYNVEEWDVFEDEIVRTYVPFRFDQINNQISIRLKFQDTVITFGQFLLDSTTESTGIEDYFVKESENSDSDFRESFWKYGNYKYLGDTAIFIDSLELKCQLFQLSRRTSHAFSERRIFLSRKLPYPFWIKFILHHPGLLISMAVKTGFCTVNVK